VEDPKYFKNTNGFELIKKSEGAQMCAINNILYGATPGSCQLHFEKNNGSKGWKIEAKGGAQCRATCYFIKVKQYSPILTIN
jgi:hypothetical protein